MKTNATFIVPSRSEMYQELKAVIGQFDTVQTVNSHLIRKIRIMRIMIWPLVALVIILSLALIYCMYVINTYIGL